MDNQQSDILTALIEIDAKPGAIAAQLEPLVAQLYAGAFRNPVWRIPTKPFRTLQLHDFHLPAVDMTVVEAALKASCPVDFMVMSELFNEDAFSPFDDVPWTNPDAEHILGGKILDMALDYGVKQILWLQSNHDSRPGRWVSRNVVGQDRVKQIVKGLTELRDKLMGLEKKGKLARHDFGHVQMGGLLVSHGDKFLVTQGKSAEAYLDKLGSQANVYRVDLSRIQLCAVPHEHRMSQTYAAGRQIMLWVMPSCCYFPPYALRGKPAGYNRFSQVNGWAVTQHDRAGAVVLSESRLVHWQYAQLPKGVKSW